MPLAGGAFGQETAKDLVDSMEDNLARWSSLEESSFTLLALVFISTEVCISRDVGLLRLYRALEPMMGGLDAARKTAFKNSVAKKLMDTLLTCLGCRQHGFTSRWTGLLLVELMKTKENMDALRATCEHKSHLSRTHKIVVEGHHLIPKYICASLVLTR